MTHGNLDLRDLKGRRRPIQTIPAQAFFRLSRREQLEAVSRYLLQADCEVTRSREVGGGARALAPIARAMELADEARRLLSLLKGGA